MTPLAHSLASQLLAPQKNTFWGTHNDTLRHFLSNAHFFDVSATAPLLRETTEIVKKMPEQDADEMIGRCAFLPAPMTWIEWKNPLVDGGRIALLAVEKGDWAHVVHIWEHGSGNTGRISLRDSTWQTEEVFTPVPPKLSAQVGRDLFRQLLMHLHFWLLLINSPQIIDRAQHKAHAGMQKKLRHSLGQKAFQLKGWTEIKLRVAKPSDIDDGEPHTSYITGKRALHFCRKHIRVRHGKLEYVRSHWRGTPESGIVRSRYKVTP